MSTSQSGDAPRSVEPPTGLRESRGAYHADFVHIYHWPLWKGHVIP